MKLKIKVVYEWEQDVECTVEEMLEALQDDVILLTQDQIPQLEVKEVRDE